MLLEPTAPRACSAGAGPAGRGRPSSRARPPRRSASVDAMRSMDTDSTAAADTEWIESEPCSNGMRDRPFAMSSASAMRTMPASRVSGLPPERCEMMACCTSARMIARMSGCVDLGQDLPQLRLRDEEGVALVIGPVDRHPQVVKERGQGDDHLRVHRRPSRSSRPRRVRRPHRPECAAFARRCSSRSSRAPDRGRSCAAAPRRSRSLRSIGRRGRRPRLRSP